MTTTISHPHAEFDQYPALLEDLADEFGTEGLTATAARIIDAEFMDFHWEGRFAERLINTLEEFDGEAGTFYRVVIIGYFQGRYYTATCLKDDAQRVFWMLNPRTFEGYEAALETFTAGG